MSLWTAKGLLNKYVQAQRIQDGKSSTKLPSLIQLMWGRAKTSLSNWQHWPPHANIIWHTRHSRLLIHTHISTNSHWCHRHQVLIFTTVVNYLKCNYCHLSSSELSLLFICSKLNHFDGRAFTTHLLRLKPRRKNKTNLTFLNFGFGLWSLVNSSFETNIDIQF